MIPCIHTYNSIWIVPFEFWLIKLCFQIWILASTLINFERACVLTVFGWGLSRHCNLLQLWGGSIFVRFNHILNNWRHCSVCMRIASLNQNRIGKAWFLGWFIAIYLWRRNLNMWFGVKLIIASARFVDLILFGLIILLNIPTCRARRPVDRDDRTTRPKLPHAATTLSALFFTACTIGPTSTPIFSLAIILTSLQNAF